MHLYSNSGTCGAASAPKLSLNSISECTFESRTMCLLIGIPSVAVVPLPRSRVHISLRPRQFTLHRRHRAHDDKVAGVRRAIWPSAVVNWIQYWTGSLSVWFVKSGQSPEFPFFSVSSLRAEGFLDSWKIETKPTKVNGNNFSLISHVLSIGQPLVWHNRLLFLFCSFHWNLNAGNNKLKRTVCERSRVRSDYSFAKTHSRSMLKVKRSRCRWRQIKIHITWSFLWKKMNFTTFWNRTKFR